MWTLVCSGENITGSIDKSHRGGVDTDCRDAVEISGEPHAATNLVLDGRVHLPTNVRMAVSPARDADDEFVADSHLRAGFVQGELIVGGVAGIAHSPSVARANEDLD